MSATDELPSISSDALMLRYSPHGVCFVDGKEMAQTFHIGCKVP
nr:MAG TPA: hypothetical protein [Caudoviricetes sp.]